MPLKWVGKWREGNGARRVPRGGAHLESHQGGRAPAGQVGRRDSELPRPEGGPGQPAGAALGLGPYLVFKL